MRVVRRTVAVLAALAFGVGLIGWADLSLVWRLSEGGTVEDIAWGGLAGVIVPAAFLAQVRRARPAALTLAVAGVTGCAVAAANQTRFLAPALAAATAAAIVAWTARGAPAGWARPSMTLTLLAVGAAIPLAVWASRLSGRRSATGNAHWSLDAVIAVEAFAVAAAFTALVGGLGLAARRLAGWCAGATVAYVGVASAVYPRAEASAGRFWGTLAIVWGLVFIGVAELETRRGRTGARPRRAGASEVT